MGDVTVRPARPGDEHEILRVFASAIRELAKDHYSPVQIEDWASAYTLDKVQRAMESAVVLVAESGGRVVGFGHVDVGWGVVDAVFVEPTSARGGVGDTILDQLEQIARERGVTSLKLRASLNAFEFYRQFGYEEVERIVHTTPSGVAYDCVNMEKQL